jgi:hypothetical protein
MPDSQRKVNQVDPHCSTDIRSDELSTTAQESRDVYLVLGDQHAHVEVRAEAEYSLAAACAPPVE